jgi:(5-formylfuran-3-yl)methyl phosphate synthase
MTQLLISVKNIEEAKVALEANVDIIDLKEPNMGALGALDLNSTVEIVKQVNGHSQVSATVGELHASIDELVADIQLRKNAGVDIVKIAISSFFYQAKFYDALIRLTKAGIKVVVVFFADDKLDLELLPVLKNAGVYGAMLDTKNKYKNLLQVQDQQALHLFTLQCHQNQLKSGLAGSLQPQHIDMVVELNPTYIGFRGGVCDNSQRNFALSHDKVLQVVDMLRNGNINRTKAPLI